MKHGIYTEVAKKYWSRIQQYVFMNHKMPMKKNPTFPCKSRLNSHQQQKQTHDYHSHAIPCDLARTGGICNENR